MELEAHLKAVRQAAEGQPAADPAELARRADADATVAGFLRERAAARATLVNAQTTQPVSPDAVKAATLALERLDKVVAAARDIARRETEPELTAAASRALAAKIAELETQYAVRRDVVAARKLEVDALNKTLSGVGESQLLRDHLMDDSTAQRDAIKRVRAELVAVRLAWDTESRARIREFASVVTSKQPETSVGKIGATAGIAFGAVFLLTTTFQLTGLLFRRLARET